MRRTHGLANDLASTERTARRRAGRSKQTRSILAMIVLFGLLAVLAGPSLLCHSSLPHSWVATAASEAGWEVDFESLEIGWITPLRITGIKSHGLAANTAFQIDQCQTELTLMNVWAGEVQSGQFGPIDVRGVRAEIHVANQWSSLEADLSRILDQPANGPELTPIGEVRFQDVQCTITDDVTAASWMVTQSHGEAVLNRESIEIDVSGLITQPNGNDGALAAKIWQHRGVENGVRVDLSMDTLPMSTLDLVQRRFPQSQLPTRVTGDVSGQVSAEIQSGASDVNLSLTQMRVQNLSAFDPVTGQRVWQNQLATLDGHLRWRPGRVMARDLSTQADFGVASIHGGFPDSLASDNGRPNPLAWLDDVDAIAEIEIDLPRLHAAFPDVLPLRDDVRVSAGRMTATIKPETHSEESDRRNAAGRTVADNRIVSEKRRRKLTLRSSVIEAEVPIVEANLQTTRSRPIRIAPVDFVALVSSNSQSLRAERFRLDSSFAMVEGVGELSSGNAKIQADFGKLSRVLGPLLKGDGLNIDGRIDGSVQWDAEPGGIWRLRGDGRGTDLVLVTPDGSPLEQKSLLGRVDLVGHWQPGRNGSAGSLDQLQTGKLELTGDGLDATIDLVQAVREFDATRLLPLRIRSRGRIEALATMISPWLPDSLRGVRGGYDFVARGEVSGAGSARLPALDGSLTSLEVPTTSSKFRQDQIKFHFDGDAIVPQNDVLMRSFTVAGESASAAIQGQWIDGVADME
ncbi:MAG: hypothetical protein AAF745_07480, partial [Planctomycetota bacterium]